MNIISFYDSDLRYEYALSLIKAGKIKEAAMILEEIKDKNLKILLSLLECYEILKTTYYKLKTLEAILLIKPEKAYFSAMIDELKKIKKHGKAFSYAHRGKLKFPHDPDFKKEMIEILIYKEKYQYAQKFLKNHRNCFSQEKYLFYSGFLYRENGKKFRSLLIFKKMAKKYPFNVLYRYLLASAYQSLKRRNKSEEQMSFIRDFLKQIPTIASQRTADSDFALLMQNMIEEMR